MQDMIGGGGGGWLKNSAKTSLNLGETKNLKIVEDMERRLENGGLKQEELKDERMNDEGLKY